MGSGREGEGEAACVPHLTSALHPCAASCSWEESPHSALAAVLSTLSHRRGKGPGLGRCQGWGESQALARIW